MLGHDRLGRAMQRHGPAVVPEARPGAQHVGSRCPRQGAHGREHTDEGLEDRHHARCLGLLQHQLRDEGAIGVRPPSPPGVRAGARAVPIEQRFPGRGGQTRLGAGHGRAPRCDEHHPRDGRAGRDRRGGRPAHEHPSRRCGAGPGGRHPARDLHRARHRPRAGRRARRGGSHRHRLDEPRPGHAAPRGHDRRSPRPDVAGGLPPHPDPGRRAAGRHRVAARPVAASRARSPPAIPHCPARSPRRARRRTPA